MYYNVLKLKDLIELEEGNNFEKKILMQNNTSLLEIVGLKKESIIDTHTSTSNTAILVLEGEIELHFSAEKFKIDKGEMLMFKKDHEHKVLALKDSKFLLLKI